MEKDRVKLRKLANILMCVLGVLLCVTGIFVYFTDAHDVDPLQATRALGSTFAMFGCSLVLLASLNASFWEVRDNARLARRQAIAAREAEISAREMADLIFAAMEERMEYEKSEIRGAWEEEREARAREHEAWKAEIISDIYARVMNQRDRGLLNGEDHGGEPPTLRIVSDQ